MTSDHSLVGRHVRFGGNANRGIEGVVLAVQFTNFTLMLMLERLKHPLLPDESDGARPIVFVNVDFKKGDEIYLMPPERKAAT